MALSSHALAHLLLALPDQEAVITEEGDLITGASVDSYDTYGENDKDGLPAIESRPCIVLEAEDE